MFFTTAAESIVPLAARVTLAIALTVAAAGTAKAAERVVIAVAADRSSGAGAGEYVSRTKAELEAAGLQTVVIAGPTSLSAVDLETVAARAHTTTVISIDHADGQVMAVVWARGTPSSPAVYRKIPPEPTTTTAPQVFALRATELVRAAQLEAHGARPGATASTDAESAGASAVAAATPRKQVAAFVGASFIASPDVLPLSVAPALELSWRPHNLWSIGVLAAGPFLSSTRAIWPPPDGGASGRLGGPPPLGQHSAPGGIGGPDGPTEFTYDVSYDQELFLLVGTFGSTAPRAMVFAPFVSIAAGAYRLGVRPGAVPDHSASSTTVWAPYAHAAGGLRWNLSGAIAIRAELGAGSAWFSSGTDIRGLSSLPAAPLVGTLLGVELAP